MQSRIFPAYGDSSTSQDNPGAVNQAWLNNESFNVEIDPKGDVSQKFKDKADKPSRDADSAEKTRSSYLSSSEQSSGEASEHEETRHGKKRKKHKHKHKHKKKSKQRHRSPTVKPGRRPGDIPLRTPGSLFFVEELGERNGKEEMCLLRYDYYPDANNWQLMSLYERHVPRYYRVGNAIMGLPIDSEIRMDSGKKVVAKKKIPEDRYWRNKVLPSSQESDKQEQILGFPQNDAKSSLELDGNFSKLDSNPTESEQMDSLWLTEKKASYNRHLQENPHDVERWLEFVEFMKDDVSLSMGGTTKDKANGTVLTEIQLSVIDKALEKNPYSVDLNVRALELKHELYDSHRLVSEWKKVVKDHKQNVTVWQAWLRYLQSNVNVFNVSDVIEAYGNCLQSMGGRPSLEQHTMEFFYQLIQTLTQSGHREKALSLLQAAIELHLFCPELLESASIEEKIEVLEGFWDSGVARCGEVGAAGMAAWLENYGTSKLPQPHISNSTDDETAIEDEIVRTEMKRITCWLQMENSRSSRHLYAWHDNANDGDDECEDLERIVMVEDIRSCLFPITSTKSKLRIIQIFLQFLGVKICEMKLSQVSLFNLSQISPLPTLNWPHLFAPAGELEFETALRLLSLITETKVLNGNAQTYIDITILGVQRQYLTYVQSNKPQSLKHLCKQIRKNAKKILKRDSNRSNLLVWGEYVLLEEMVGKREDVRSVLDTVLSLSPTLGAEVDVQTRSAMCKVHRCYGELELGLHDPSQASGIAMKVTEDNTRQVSRVLSSFVQRGNQTDVSVSDARDLYLNEFKEILSEDRERKEETAILEYLPQQGCLLAHCTVCFALFEYVNQDFEAALKVYEEIIAIVYIRLKEFSESIYYRLVLEDLLISKMNLIQLHFRRSKNVLPLRFVREPLLEALHMLPDSPLLLNYFITSEVATNIIGRLRRSLLKVSVKANTPLVWVYGAIAELLRIQTRDHCQNEKAGFPESSTDLQDNLSPSPSDKSSHHQLRAWFERAINHPSSKHCVLLWRLFFYFEVVVGNMNGAKMVYYRGLNLCPSAKALCMDFVEVFPNSLEEVTDYMLEKELRLRVPLEELDLLRLHPSTIQTVI